MTRSKALIMALVACCGTIVGQAAADTQQIVLSDPLPTYFECKECEVLLSGTLTANTTVVVTDGTIRVVFPGIRGTAAVPGPDGASGIPGDAANPGGTHGGAGTDGASSFSLTLTTIEGENAEIGSSIAIEAGIDLRGIAGSAGGTGADGFVDPSTCGYRLATSGGAAGAGGTGGKLTVSSSGPLVISGGTILVSGAGGGAGGAGGRLNGSFGVPIGLPAGVGQQGGLGGGAGSVSLAAASIDFVGTAVIAANGGAGGQGGNGGGFGSPVNRVGGNGGRGGAGGSIEFAAEGAIVGAASLEASGGLAGSGGIGGTSAVVDCASGRREDCGLEQPPTGVPQSGGRGLNGGSAGVIDILAGTDLQLSPFVAQASGGTGGTPGASGTGGASQATCPEFTCELRTNPAQGMRGGIGGIGGSITLTAQRVLVPGCILRTMGGDGTAGSPGGNNASLGVSINGLCIGCGYDPVTGTPSKVAGTGGQGGAGAQGGSVAIFASIEINGAGGQVYVAGGRGGNGGNGGVPEGSPGVKGSHGNAGILSSGGGAPLIVLPQVITITYPELTNGQPGDQCD